VRGKGRKGVREGSKKGREERRARQSCVGHVSSGYCSGCDRSVSEKVSQFCVVCYILLHCIVLHRRASYCTVLYCIVSNIVSFRIISYHIILSDAMSYNILYLCVQQIAPALPWPALHLPPPFLSFPLLCFSSDFFIDRSLPARTRLQYVHG
jgi:hypothetical protein